MTGHVPCNGPGTGSSVQSHDHFTTTDFEGIDHDTPFQMLCIHCRRPAHYDESDGQYHHDDPAAGCWLMGPDDQPLDEIAATETELRVAEALAAEIRIHGLATFADYQIICDSNMILAEAMEAEDLEILADGQNFHTANRIVATIDLLLWRLWGNGIGLTDPQGLEGRGLLHACGAGDIAAFDVSSGGYDSELAVSTDSAGSSSSTAATAHRSPVSAR